MREPIYFRSKNTNEVFDILTEKHRVAFYIEIPGIGRVRLRGETLRQFLWVLRSNDATILVDRWMANEKERLKDMEPITPDEPSDAVKEHRRQKERMGASNV